MNFTDPYGLFGIGVIGSVAAEGGVGLAGAAESASAGVGYFSRGGGTGVEGFESEGGFVGGPGYGPSIAPDNKDNSAVGGFAGIGAGLFFTTADCAKQLEGPSYTYSLNIGVGPISFSLQYTEYEDGNWLGSYTEGPGMGISASGYPTNTVSHTF